MKLRFVPIVSPRAVVRPVDTERPEIGQDRHAPVAEGRLLGRDELRRGEERRRGGCVWRGLAPGKAIVEAGANDEAVELRRTGDRIADLARADDRLVDQRAAVGKRDVGSAEIVIEELEFRRQLAGQRQFDAAAERPADAVVEEIALCARGQQKRRRQ